jgi:hypothetical protein
MITDCKILIRFTYRAFPFDDYKSFETEFASFPDFVNYLIWEPERGALVGFGTVADDVMKDSRNSNVSLAVKFNDGDSQHEVFFKKFEAMTDFLKQRPDLGERLQYRE